MTKDDKSRFDEKWVEDDDGCWIWTGGEKHSGYGGFWLDGERLSAHRASFILHEGEIPKGKNVLHTCHVQLCVNPDHLYAGTQKENREDAREEGNIPQGEESPHSKLTREEDEEIRDRYDEEDITQSELAEDYPITQSMVSRLLNNEAWFE